MKKRTIPIILIAVIALAIPLSVYAATSDTAAAKAVRGFLGIDPSKLTDTQKSDISDYSQRMADLQKEFIDKLVSDGTMTKEQGDAAKAKIDEQLKASKGKGMPYGLGRGAGKGFANGPMRQGGPKLGGIDTSKLTGDQKTELTGIVNNIFNLQKQIVDKYVADNLLTKEQGDNIKGKIDGMAKEAGSQNPLFAVAFGKGGMFGLSFRGVDTSKLTDNQKSEITGLENNIKASEKQLVSALVKDSVLTSAQGDSLNKMIDGTPPAMQGSFPRKGMGTGKMRPGARWNQGAPDESGNTSTKL